VYINYILYVEELDLRKEKNGFLWKKKRNLRADNMHRWYFLGFARIERKSLRVEKFYFVRGRMRCARTKNGFFRVKSKMNFCVEKMGLRVAKISFARRESGFARK
jgi:hypothetical protein